MLVAQEEKVVDDIQLCTWRCEAMLVAQEEKVVVDIQLCAWKCFTQKAHELHSQLKQIPEETSF